MKKTDLYSWLHSNAIEFDSAETAQAVLAAAKAVGHPVMIFHVSSSYTLVLMIEGFMSVPIYASRHRHKAADVPKILLALLSPPVEEPKKIKRVFAKDLKPGDRFRYVCANTDDDLRERNPVRMATDFGDGITFIWLDEYEQGRIEVSSIPHLMSPCALYHKDGTPIYEGDDE